MKERQRIDTYDYMKCIAIIIVVVGHLYNVSYDAEILGSSTRSLVCVFINVSEMPLFFFVWLVCKTTKQDERHWFKTFR